MASGSGVVSDLEVFVFPLTRVTLFPRIAKPLSIFEPRYIKMVNDALACEDGKRRIALAYAEPGLAAAAKITGVQAHVRSVAGVGIVHLIERRADGTMLIKLDPDGKVHLDQVIESDEPYIRAQASWIKEETTLLPQNIFVMHRLLKALGRWLALHVPDESARRGLMQNLNTAESRVNAICSLMVLDSELQQTLLELNSINDRIQALALAIESEGLSQ